jgi:hypothetical protein
MDRFSFILADVRDAFAHEAMLVMPVDADVRAPGAVITAELCGHWEHQPPCPLAAHHSKSERVGDAVRVRVLFATFSENEGEVRRRINQALERGRLVSAEGDVTVWRVTRTGRSIVDSSEIQHTQRLVETPQ